MKRFVRYSSAAALAAGFMVGAAAFASTEVIRITPVTTAVGVFQGDDVRFIDASSGESVTAHIEGQAPFELKRIAPDLPNAQHVKAYIWDETGQGAG
jgi:hypothetical protein